MMEVETTEDRVTKMLSTSEILSIDEKPMFVSNPSFNLGEFLENVKPKRGRFGAKYRFVK